MKLMLAAMLVVALAWLGLWAFNVRYFIGVSVLSRIEPLAERCPLVRTIGN